MQDSAKTPLLRTHFDATPPPPPYQAAPIMSVQNARLSTSQQKEWEGHLLGCCSSGNRGDALLACCVPSASYGVLKSRVESLKAQQGPHPTRGTAINAFCGAHVMASVMSFVAAAMAPIPFLTSFPRFLEWQLREDVRALSNVTGSHMGDCLAVFCCHSCALVQEMKELDRLENQCIQLDGSDSALIVQEQSKTAMMQV